MTETNLLLNIGLPVCAYLSGSIASAIIVCKLMGLSDPRAAGSGNPGATNVLRLHGRPAAILTLAGDVLKGFIPVWLARLLEAPDLITALCALTAFLGHLYPIFFGFRGGKGVATLIGTLFALHWLLGLGFVGTWLLIAWLSRYSSLAAIGATVLTPMYTWLLIARPIYVSCLGSMCAILIWSHRANIKNLLAGTEDKIGAKKT